MLLAHTVALLLDIVYAQFPAPEDKTLAWSAYWDAVEAVWKAEHALLDLVLDRPEYWARKQAELDEWEEEEAIRLAQEQDACLEVLAE